MVNLRPWELATHYANPAYAINGCMLDLECDPTATGGWGGP
ncbi:MAG: hypothetical protein PVJ49_02665 [Acidobacteriota bacterium]